MSIKNRLGLVSVCLFFLNIGNLLAWQAVSDAFPTIPEYRPEIIPVDLNLDDQSYRGFATDFDFSTAALKKGWWKYLSSVARVKDRKTYWILTVPAKKGESTEPVVMFSTIKKTSVSNRLTLALDGSGMDETDRKDYLTQVQKFLAEFKAKFYGDYLQERIAMAEKEARDVSKKQQKHVKKVIKLRKDLEKENQRLSKSAGGAPSRSIQSTTLSTEITMAEAEANKEGERLEKIKQEIELLKKTLLTYVNKVGI